LQKRVIKGEKKLKPIVQYIKARMMQEYEFTHADTFPTSASTSIQPSEQILQKILSFARCCQTVEAGGLKMKLFLN
jgi:hypothetical protein